MAKSNVRERPAYRCEECGYEVAKWVGRCPECQAWGSVAERGVRQLRSVVPVQSASPAVPIAQVDGQAAQARPTGVGELDRTLSGGLVPGAVVLLAGEPGVGKSTLLLAAATRCGQRVLYVTGEESAAQVRLRAGRIGALSPDLYLAAETDLATVLGHIEAVSPAVLIVDSVQTIGSAGVDGSPGGVTQVRETATALTRIAKERGIATVLVGHVTKDGSVAGPRLLEHMVDVVLHFEGDRHSRLRLVRTVKNRFGPADEVGCFDLTDDGVEELPDPSGLFLSRHAEPVPGTCVTVAVEGRRALVTEVQALVGGNDIASPRRTTSGLDGARLAMVLAVLDRRAGLPLSGRDIYAATVGGVRLAEPAADLAVTLAVASSIRDRSLPAGLVAAGEVGLAGEVRPVTGLGRRLAEAARLGFTHALVPGDPGHVPAGLRVVEVADVAAALTRLGLARGSRP